jgi:hypothetical protein
MVAPGVLFCWDLSKLLLPTILVHASVRLVSYVYSWSIPTAVFVAVWIFTFPAYLEVQATYTRSKHMREARKLGAELIPSVKGKWPGNVDILYNAFIKKGVYLGDGFVARIQTHGSTYALTTLGDTRVLTINPENIKRMLATDFDNYVKGVSFNT